MSSCSRARASWVCPPIELKLAGELQESRRARIARVVTMAESRRRVSAGLTTLIEQAPCGIVMRGTQSPTNGKSFVEEVKTALDASPAVQWGTQREHPGGGCRS